MAQAELSRKNNAFNCGLHLSTICMKYMGSKHCSVIFCLFVFTVMYKQIRNVYPVWHTPFYLLHTLLQDRCHWALETAKCCHVLGLFAWDTPVVGLMDRLVVFPGWFVVHREPLNGLSGECLTRDWENTVKNQDIHNVNVLFSPPS